MKFYNNALQKTLKDRLLVLLLMALTYTGCGPTRFITRPVVPNTPVQAVNPFYAHSSLLNKPYHRLCKAFANQLLADGEMQASFQVLEGLLAPLDSVALGLRLSAVPAAISGRISPQRIIDRFIQTAAATGWHDPIHLREPPPAPPQTEPLDRVLHTSLAAYLKVIEAYKPLPPPLLAELSRQIPVLLERFVHQETIANHEDAICLLALVRKIRYALLYEALHLLKPLCDPQLHRELLAQSLKRPLSFGAPFKPVTQLDPAFEGRFLAALETPMGLFLVGDVSDNIYGGDAAVIVDLGGNDTYTRQCGASSHLMAQHEIEEVTRHLGIIIDLDGNDRYLSTSVASVAAGFLGLGMIIDAGGNDFYAGDRITGGAAFGGLGCLVDLKGNDTYAGQELTQGAAIFGGALLVDLAGNDCYQAAKYGQGFGGPYGVGLLVDLEGNDLYVAGFKHGSPYGTPKIFQRVSHGAGWGCRGIQGGGIGILSDLAGNDVYQAGNFSQGAGYYYGLGILSDTAGHDLYQGQRFSQGAAAHTAVGILLEHGGNDRYLGAIAANQGGAWDVAVAVLLDYDGNDRYSGGMLSLGAAEQNGIGLLGDLDGQDQYMYLAKSAGFGGDHFYSGGRGAENIGIFIDLGGEEDFYPHGPRSNNTLLTSKQGGQFIDE